MFLVASSCLWIHCSQGLGREWKSCWSSADRRCSNYIWVINNFIAYGGRGATYIRGLMVFTLYLSGANQTKTMAADALAPWSPGHQWTWLMYWLCRINKALSSRRNDSKYWYLRHFSVGKWKKMHVHNFMFPQNKFRIIRVRICGMCYEA